MTYQPLYGMMDDGLGRRTTHSRHGKVARIEGWINTNRGKAFDFRVRDNGDRVRVFIQLKNVDVNSWEVIKNGEDGSVIEFEITRPIVTAQEYKTGEK